MHHKNRVEETRVRISLYPLLTVQPPDLILSSLVSHATATLCGALHARRAAARHPSAFRNGTVRSDFSFPAAHGLEIVTTGHSDSSPVVYEHPARSVHGFSLITAPVLTFLFTGRE